MNTARIRNAASEIERLSNALAWLREHGANLNHRDRDSFEAFVRVHRASALTGADEANKQLSAMARLQIQDLVNLAIVDAENTIEMHRSALREECA